MSYEFYTIVAPSMHCSMKLGMADMKQFQRFARSRSADVSKH